MKKDFIKEDKIKYVKKNHIFSNKKNKYNKTSLSILTSLPNLSQNNFINILNEYNPQVNNDISTEKIEILEDGSVCRKNTKNTTRLNSPQNDNYNIDINNEDYIYNTGLKYNKSVPNIRTFTYTKDKENFANGVYIPHKPYDNSGKSKINIKSKKDYDIKNNSNNKESNYKRVLFNNQEDDYENDIINTWKYLSKKYIMYYNNQISNTEIQVIIQNLKINQILKKKQKLPTNLLNIINYQEQNMNEINLNFFDEVEKKFKKEDKMCKYKADIESINEEMNESNEDQEEIKSIKSNRIKENKLKTNKNINELKIKDIESISFIPMSAKNKDVKFIFNKINDKNIQSKDMHFIYKKENIIKKGIKFKFNENKNNRKDKINNDTNKIMLRLSKEKYESLILAMIHNFIYYKNGNKNDINIDAKNINDNLNKKIKEFEESIKELKNIYIYGINNVQLISIEKDKINFIKKLNLTKKRNNVKKIYKEIITLLKNNKENNTNYYQKIIDMLKIYQKINENEFKINKSNKVFIINNILIKMLLFFLPIIFAFKYYNNNFRKI